jgi:hypothetical protein
MLQVEKKYPHLKSAEEGKESNDVALLSKTNKSSEKWTKKNTTNHPHHTFNGGEDSSSRISHYCMLFLLVLLVKMFGTLTLMQVGILVVYRVQGKLRRFGIFG